MTRFGTSANWFKDSLTFGDSLTPSSASVFTLTHALGVVTCPLRQSERHEELIKQLRVYANLADNWDGYGGLKISQSALTQARALVDTQLLHTGRDMLSFPEITPTPNGTLVIEWQGQQGEAAVEIGNTRVSGLVKRAGAPALSIRGDSQKVTDYLPLFIAPLLNPGTQQKTSTVTPVEYDSAANG